MMEDRRKLTFRMLAGQYAIVRLPVSSAFPRWANSGEVISVTRTSEELSVVCPIENLPPEVTSTHRWTCMKLEGPFPFSMTGVLLSFIEPLSLNRIPIFAVSTFDTDYVLVQEEHAHAALNFLQAAGHELAA